MNEFWKILSDILPSTFLIFLVIGCVASLLIGVVMMIRPEIALKLNRDLDKWFATRGLEVVLNKTRKTDHHMHGGHRIAGAAILLAALYLLYTQATGKMPPAALADLFGLKASGWLVGVVLWLLALGGIMASVIGFLLLAQSPILKKLEAWANRWHATDRFSELIDQAHYQPNQFVARHAQWTGGFIAAGSLYVLAMLGYFLL